MTGNSRTYSNSVIINLHVVKLNLIFYIVFTLASIFNFFFLIFVILPWCPFNL